MADLYINAQGDLEAVYTEEIDLMDLLTELGEIQTCRASHVEPTPENSWVADMSPRGGPSLGPFRLHSEAIAAEQEWLKGDLESG